MSKINARLSITLDIKFVNVKTWQDLDKPKLTKTEQVLGAFEG